MRLPFQVDLLAADVARADARQARLLGNPALDATWSTVPTGESVGASYTFPLGKAEEQAGLTA